MQVISNPTAPTLLIADNDPTTLETLTGFFKEEGNKVIPAPNLEATETLIKLSRNELDAVILDGRLVRESDAKDRSGWDLAERTLKEDPDLLVIIHSRVAPKDSPLAGHPIAQQKGKPKVIEIPKSDLPALNRTLKEELGKKRELNQLRSSQEMPVRKEPSAAPIWSKQHKALIGLIALLLALICGLAAVLLGEPKFLVAAVVSAVVAFVFVSLTLE